MNWFKKKEIPKGNYEEKVVTNNIEITFNDGKTFGWKINNFKGKNKTESWLHFYRWYFGRETEAYVFKSSDSDTMFLRKDIARFRVWLS